MAALFPLDVGSTELSTPAEAARLAPFAPLLPLAPLGPLAPRTPCTTRTPLGALAPRTPCTTRTPLGALVALAPLTLFALLVACEAPPARVSCARPDPSALDRMVPCDEGSGLFGDWIVDGQGLPAYRYTLDQRSDPRAEWTLSSGEVRREHRFLVGNDRLHAFATQEGFVELFTRERGPVLWNRLDPATGRTGGGYSYLRDEGSGATWATAHALCPSSAETRRYFGVGYARYVTVYSGIRVDRRVVAPPGDWPFLVDEVMVTNESDRTRRIRHYELWDVNRHPLVLQLARSGSLTPDLPAQGDLQRAAQNRLFEIEARLSPGRDAVLVGHTYSGSDPNPPEAPADRDHHPYDLFLARLLPPTHAEPLRAHTDRAAFLGAGGVANPDAVRLGSAPAPLLLAQEAEGQPGLLAEEVPLVLASGESRRLRYALGVTPPEAGVGGFGALREEGHDAVADLARAWRERLPWVDVPEAPVLHREMAWHAAMLQGAAVWDDYFEAHTITQGSVYLYGHGLDGAGRDFALFAVPAAYLQPSVARGCLRTLMRMTYTDTRQISYAVQGHGVLETAGIHRAPSDVDLFFLWGVSEYLAATGDQAFLEDLSPYWPKEPSALHTTREHIRSQVRHLLDRVGVGEHGLVRIGTGDWSDGITMQASDRALAEAEGESVPNSQMAVWVLPRVAALFDAEDPGLAAELRDFAQTQAQAASEQWLGAWYRRAWFGGGEAYGEGHLDLEAQVWALIAGLPDAGEQALLLGEIASRLDDPSPVGAPLWPGGDVWHAITGLLTWGYALRAPERAWGALRRHTLAAYATEHPDQWYGIWSGPDALGVGGGTWGSVVTPMMDFPVFNANQHAMPLLALLRVAGVEPALAGDGLRVAPTRPDALSGSPITVDLPLLRVRWDHQALGVTYRALTPSRTTLYIAPPPGASVAWVDDQPVPLPGPGEDLRVPVNLESGQQLRMCIAGPSSVALEVCP